MSDEETRDLLGPAEKLIAEELSQNLTAIGECMARSLLVIRAFQTADWSAFLLDADKKNMTVSFLPAMREMHAEVVFHLSMLTISTLAFDQTDAVQAEFERIRDL